MDAISCDQQSRNHGFASLVFMEIGFGPKVMLKAQCLCTQVQISETVLGEVEKDSFITCQGRGECSRLLLLKTKCSNSEDLMRGFITMIQSWGL